MLFLYPTQRFKRSFRSHTLQYQPYDSRRIYKQRYTSSTSPNSCPGDSKEKKVRKTTNATNEDEQVCLEILLLF